MISRTKVATFSLAIMMMLGSAGCQAGALDSQPGLTGLYFSEPDLTAVKAKMLLTTLQQDWNELTFQTTGSSGIWDGGIVGPADGEVTFHLSTNKIVELQVGDASMVRASAASPESTLSVMMAVGESYPVHLTFYKRWQERWSGFWPVFNQMELEWFGAV